MLCYARIQFFKLLLLLLWRSGCSKNKSFEPVQKFKNFEINDLYVSFLVTSAQRKYFVTYKSYISGNDDKVVSNSNPTSCAASCLSEAAFICRSFEFDNSSNTCQMSAKSSINSALATASGTRFFELST